MCARYYPNGNNHPKKSDSVGPGGPPNTIDDNGISRWLYEGLDGNWTKEDQERFERMYSIKGYKEYLDYLLDKEQRERIFNLYGIQYSDIRDPRNVKGAASTSRMYTAAYNFVSDNVKRLYR